MCRVFEVSLNQVSLRRSYARVPPTPLPRRCALNSPEPEESLTWLAWHTAREIDLQVSALAGTEPLWTGAGFSARFALPLPDGTEDWRHAPEQAALVRMNDLALLTDYLDATSRRPRRGPAPDALRRGPRPTRTNARLQGRLHQAAQ